MKQVVLLLGAAVLAACGGPRKGAGTPGPSGTPLSPAQIAERALPSVVHVKATWSENRETKGMAGTGFVVWSDGRIVTNFHVVMPAANEDGRLLVVLPDGTESDNVEILAADPEHDLAVIRVRAARGLPVLALGDSSKVKPGESVVAIGHPLGFGNTVSNGIVSAVREIDDQHTLIQVSAPVSEGSSGGPLFNDRGEVIGVTLGFRQEGQNLNFGVPANDIKPLLLEEQAVAPRELMRKVTSRLVKGCKFEEALRAGAAIEAAIKIGVPTFNSGDHAGCYLIYADTAKKLVADAGECRLIGVTLANALEQAERDQDPTDKAWTMRRAFDKILVVLTMLANDPQRARPR